jgi:heme-degrading monooxygenase HmoA
VRRLLFPASLIVTLALIASGSAPAQTPGDKEVTIAMDMTVAKSASNEDLDQALRRLTAAVRKQPGLLNQVVLKNAVPTHRPTHVYVTRWRTLGDWERMLANPEIQQVTNQYRSVFTLDSTDVYTPVDLPRERSR